MKIPVQEKIAELESRIEKLEKEVKRLKELRQTVTVMGEEANEIFESSAWKNMWKNFEEVMEKFGRVFR